MNIHAIGCLSRSCFSIALLQTRMAWRMTSLTLQTDFPGRLCVSSKPRKLCHLDEHRCFCFFFFSQKSPAVSVHQSVGSVSFAPSFRGSVWLSGRSWWFTACFVLGRPCEVFIRCGITDVKPTILFSQHIGISCVFSHSVKRLNEVLDFHPPTRASAQALGQLRRAIQVRKAMTNWFGEVNENHAFRGHSFAWRKSPCPSRFKEN